MSAPNLSYTVDSRVSRRRMPAGIVGMIGGSPLNRVEACIHSYPQAEQVDTLTVGSFAVEDYSFAVNGIALTYTAISGDATTTGVAAKIAALINATPSVRGQVRASAQGAVVTLTGTYPGLVFTLAEEDAKLTTASVTVASQGAPMPCGRAVLLGDQPIVESGAYSERLANSSIAPALVTLLGARVVTLTPTAVDDTLYAATITVGGAGYALSYTSDASATAGEIATGLALSAPAGLASAGVTLDDTDGVLTVTGAPGQSYTVTPSAGQLATAIVSAGTDVAARLAGITTECAGLFESPTLAPGPMVWPAEHPVGVLRTGDIMVQSTEAVAPGDAVYVETAAGDDTGRLYATPTASRFLWPRASWKRRASTSDDLAWIELR